MHYNVYDVFSSQYSHQHISAAIAAIFSVMLLLQQHNECTNTVSCVAVTLQQLKNYYNVNFCPPSCYQKI